MTINEDIEASRRLARDAGMHKFRYTLEGKDLYMGNLFSPKRDSIDHGYYSVCVAVSNGKTYTYSTGGSNSSFLDATKMAIQDIRSILSGKPALEKHEA